MTAEEYRQTAQERDVQSGIIDGLQLLGCRIIVTSRQWRRCEECGHVNHKKGDGVTKGCPDLLVRHRSWPVDIWIGYEIKGPRTPVSPEQRELAEAGHTYIIRTMEEAAEILQRCNRKWSGAVCWAR